VCGDSTDEIRTQYEEIKKILVENIDKELPTNTGQLSEAYAKRLSNSIAKQLGIDPDNVEYRINGLNQYFTTSSDIFEMVNKPFTPDDIVYCKSNYLYSTSGLDDLGTDVTKFSDRYGYLPKIIALEGKGIVAIETGEQDVRTVMDVFENMMKVSYFSQCFGGPQFMNPEQIEFIDNWEVENYRRTVTSDK